MATERQGPGGDPASGIELRQIRHAIAVADQGSISLAAAQLQLSQSTLSRSVSALEARLGKALFKRSSEGLELTDLGRLFIERGQAMVAAADELDRLIGRNASLHAGRLVVGLGATMCEAAASTVVAQMMAEMPSITLELRSSFRDDLVPPLQHGELDVLIADGSPFATGGDYEVQPLPALPLIVTVRQGHALAARPRFEMSSIFDHPVYAGGRIQPKVLNGLLQEQAGADGVLARTRPLPALMGSSVAMLLSTVERTDCVTACSPALARQGIEAGRLVPLAAPSWMQSPYALVRHRARSASAAADTFCRLFVAAHHAEVDEAYRLIQAWLPGTSPD